jgi:hypothetical protein
MASKNQLRANCVHVTKLAQITKMHVTQKNSHQDQDWKRIDVTEAPQLDAASMLVAVERGIRAGNRRVHKWMRYDAWLRIDGVPHRPSGRSINGINNSIEEKRSGFRRASGVS